LTPKVVEPALEERVGPNQIIERYRTQSDAGDGLVVMPCTEQGCQKQIKPSYWWVCLYHPIEICTLALGQVASKMIFIEQANLLCQEVISNEFNCFQF
jgi:hypothetical protein